MTYPTKEHPNQFRERLLAADTHTPALRADYERRLQAMFDVRLGKPKRVWFAALAAFCGVAGTLSLVLVLTETLPWPARTGLLMGAAFAACWAAYLVRIVVRGTYRRRIDAPLAAGMAFVFALLMCVLFAVAGMPADQVALMGILFLLPAGLIVIRTVVEQSEMRTQERLVGLEYRLARLSEKLGAGGDDGDDLLGTGVPR